ncbi:MAG: hypothetical protein R3F14_26255 [Polyangiaceae bacterium]
MHILFSRHAAALIAAPAFVLAACDTAPSSPPKRGAEVAPHASELAVSEVRWPGADTVDARVVGALPEEAAARVRGSRVPVLLPPRAGWLSTVTVVTKPLWTTASMKAEGATIVVTASRAARRVEGVGPAEGNRAMRGARGFVTQNEGIWSASWSENGVAYSVEVECDAPSAEACASDALVMAVTEELAFAGGEGAKEGAR